MKYTLKSKSFKFNSFVSQKTKNSYEGDYYGLATKHFFENVIQKDKSEKVNVGVASHTPLQRGLEALSLDLKKRMLETNHFRRHQPF